MVNVTILPAIENVLLVGPHHRDGVIAGRRRRRSSPAARPLVPVKAGARVPNHMVDVAIRSSVENVLLVGPHHCGRVAGGRRRGRSSPVASPLVPVKAGARIPNHMVDVAIRSSVENVLLVGPHHCNGVTVGGRGSGVSSFTWSASPLIPDKYVRVRIPNRVVNISVRTSIEDVLLVGLHHRGRRTHSGRGRPLKLDGEGYEIPGIRTTSRGRIRSRIVPPL